MKLAALSYYGGKSSIGGKKQGRWIASLLPSDTRTLYCEPYAGMLGILLQRSPSKLEIVNDLNERVVNWWRVVRDHPDELAHKIKYTPHSEAEFHYAIDHLDEGDSITRANNFTTVIAQALFHADAKTSWSGKYYVGVGTPFPDYSKRINLLSSRLKNVQLFCRPASKIIKRVCEEPNSIMYIDPPYQQANTSPYAVVEDEHDTLLELLPSVQGKVAISGYGDEWDELNWHRHEFDTLWSGLAKGETDQPRTEVLWTNYTPEQNGRLF